MKTTFFPILILLTIISCQNKTGEYVCTPCDLPCDELLFNEPGICPHCKMDLIKKSKLIPEKILMLNEINIINGTGEFLIEGGYEKEKTIVVHYYKPEKLKADSQVLIVLPGAGRDGDEYRDAWIEIAENKNVLILSLEYSEEHYPEFWSYNLAGMLTDVVINEERTAMESFKINQNSASWIFNDFDRIFNLTKEALHLTTEQYDLFGHSAGGQILHRFAMFNSKNKAKRILAANAGWYTIPSISDKFPEGVQGVHGSKAQLDFSSNLVLFLGEKDDADETRGNLRRSPEVDKQGLHRLARGNYFYNQSKGIASKLSTEFNWKLELVPDVGHDFRGMSRAAGEYLYGMEE